MKRFLFIVFLSISFLLLAAVPAFAQVPIGGKVTAVFPCLHSGGYLYTVVGFGLGSGLFWYFPGVLTYPLGPPIIGEWVLGLAAPVGACGLATEFEGTGII